MRAVRHPSGSERGATIIIVAASLLMLMGVAAMALDLSGLRLDIRADRLASDAAATAGVANINPFAASEADEACAVAWDYLLLNLNDAQPIVSTPNCANFAPACTSTSPRVATGAAGPYEFTIIHPVPDNHEWMSGQAINPDLDGAPCQRLGVGVVRTRDFTFGRVIGFESGTTGVRSVARIRPGAGEGDLVPLVVLEPVACRALYVSGQGGVTVTHFEDSPGIIAVDSDGSGGTGNNACTASRYTMEAQGNTHGWIRALDVPAPDNIPSAILSYALTGIPPANPARSYNPDNLTQPATGTDPSDPAETQFRLYPQPQPRSFRVTRAPIDWRYNCKSSYPDYLGSVPVDPCLDPPAPHIDQLKTAYGGNIAPPGFPRWSDAHPCNVNSDLTLPPGNWYIDCSPRLVVNGATLTLGAGDLVLEQNTDIDIRSDGELFVNPGQTDDVIIFVRGDGDLLKRAQSSIELHRTFVYLETGAIDLAGGDGGLEWTAPLGGNFEDLALWAEAQVLFNLGGQAGNVLTGTFFTPLATPFNLSGQSGQLQTDAQFVTRRLEVTGQAEVRMQPDPTTQTPIPTREISLIR